MNSEANSKEVSTDIQSQKKKETKILCTKCVQSIPAYQYDFHYEMCQLIEETEEYVFFCKDENSEPHLVDFNIDHGELPISGSYVYSSKEKLSGRNIIELR